MHRILAAVVHTLRSLLRSRFDLAMENAALRQQLAVMKQSRIRPRLRGTDRLFWVVLRRVWSGWTDALIVVKPETVVRWHRAGFRAYWRWKSRRKGRPQSHREIRNLICKMATDNGCGAPRIHAELCKLGFLVSERTVSRYMPRKPAGPDAVERWKRFLQNHRDVLAGMDFFSVPTATFRVLYVFFVIGHGRRRVLLTNVTAHPTAEWIIQQLREAFPFDTAPRYLILDRDGKYGSVVPEKLRSWGVKLVRTGWRSPWQNGVAERWVLSARQELLDHVVVFNEAHLRRLLAEYVSYYNIDRCHLALDKDAPEPRDVRPRPTAPAKVVALPRVGGIHHRYEWSDRPRLAA
jgi:transposase InsO family protein